MHICIISPVLSPVLKGTVQHFKDKLRWTPQLSLCSLEGEPRPSSVSDSQQCYTQLYQSKQRLRTTNTEAAV